MNRLKSLAIAILWLLGPLSGSIILAGEPVCHIMICCRSSNEGTKFLVNGEWNPSHDYRDIEQVRGIMKNIRNAGINTVCIDMTNPSQWTRFWDGNFELMFENVRTVCAETGMQYFVFIGAQLSAEIKENNDIPADVTAFEFWNQQAEFIWNNWVPDPAYRYYGYGDDRPILCVFLPSQSYWGQYDNAPAEDKSYLSRFHIGTMQVNDAIDFQDSDGWGYRNYSQSTDGSVRFASPNGGVNPTDPWYRISEEEWTNRVDWAGEASEYSIYGSYDDACDAIHWGIADTRDVDVSNIDMKYPNDDPWVYYDIVKQALNPRQALVHQFEFNDGGAPEGWSGNADLGSLVQTGSLNGVDGVLSSSGGVSGAGPSLSYQSELIIPLECGSFSTIEIRIRQLDLTGTDFQDWDPQGTFMEIQAKDPLSTGEINVPEWTIKHEALGGWIVASADISEVLSDTITEISIGPLGNSAGIGKNFEIDYVRLYAFCPMEAPSGITTTIGNDTVLLDWEDNPETDLEAYRVYRSLASEGPFILKESGLQTSEYTDVGFARDAAYYYVITAVDSTENESEFSDTVSVRPLMRKKDVHRFEFNTQGNTEAWTGNSHAGTLAQGKSLNGVDSVLISAGGITGEDPRIAFQQALIHPEGYDVWAGISMRLRQVNESGTASQPWDMDGTGGYLMVPDSLGLGGKDTPGWTISSEQEGDWVLAVADISAADSVDISAVFLDPIGGVEATGKNFEIDYIRISAYCPMRIPEGLSVAEEDGSAVLTWDPLTESEISAYRVYRSSSSGGPYVQLDEVIEIGYSDTVLVSGLSYFYVVTAVDSLNNESAYSAEVDFKPEGGNETVLYQFEFNAAGNKEGWTGNDDVGGLVQLTSINGSDGVLSSEKGISNIDPRLFYTPGLTLPTGYAAWMAIELRVRQLDETGLASQAFDPQGTIGYFVHSETFSLGEIIAPTWSIMEETEGDWIIARADISSLDKVQIEYMFIDLIGNAPGIGKNFELDYVRITAYRPMKAPAGLVANTGVGAIELDWEDNMEPELKHYNVYRSNTSGVRYSKIANELNLSNYVDEDVEYGKTYYYVTTAVDTNNFESAYSNEVAASSLNTSIDEHQASRAGLKQNYPNPFHTETHISYQVENAGNVRIGIYNISGQKVAELVNEVKQPGAYTVSWNARQCNGGLVPEGIYFCRMLAGDSVSQVSMVLIK